MARIHVLFAVALCASLIEAKKTGERDIWKDFENQADTLELSNRNSHDKPEPTQTSRLFFQKDSDVVPNAGVDTSYTQQTQQQLDLQMQQQQMQQQLQQQQQQQVQQSQQQVQPPQLQPPPPPPPVIPSANEATNSSIKEEIIKALCSRVRKIVNFLEHPITNVKRAIHRVLHWRNSTNSTAATQNPPQQQMYQPQQPQLYPPQQQQWSPPQQQQWSPPQQQQWSPPQQQQWSSPQQQQMYPAQQQQQQQQMYPSQNTQPFGSY